MPASETPSTLDPQGEGAHVISQEMWIQFGVSAAIFALVVGLLVWVLVTRSRRAAPDPDEARARRWVLLGGVAMPVLVLTGLFAVSVRSLAALSEPSQAEVTTIEVIGHRWWWEAHYPANGITTANELVVPVDRAVRLRLRSKDVIHSFWVPKLQRKLDLFPNEWTTTWLEADTEGIYRGVCAEFCGLQHARMHFLVKVVGQNEWADWLVHAQEPAREPTTVGQRRGREVFVSSACAYCHTISGTPAAGQVGPDLTHLASRQSIAGATLPLNRGNLGGWIADPQHQKPGALMPRVPLSGPDFQALLDYLESLK